MTAEITFDDFLKVDVRVGTIIKTEEFPEARRPAYKIWVDFGEEIGVKKSSAQITHKYQLDELVGTQVSAVVNFPPRQIGPIKSEILILGFYDADGSVSLVRPDHNVPNGARLG